MCSTRDAVVVSSDILLFIVFRQAAFVIRSVCSLPRIARLHLMIQIRYAASDTRIFNSLVAPAFGRSGATLVLLRWCSSAVHVLTSSSPHPIIVHRVISGHVSSPCGHTPFARDHISLIVGCMHSVSMWFIVSSSSQVLQVALWSYPSTFSQKRPIFCIPCIV